MMRRVHEVTAGWSQRPGHASTRELLEVERGGDVDLSAMPRAAVDECRRAWARLAGTPEAVVHGDPGPANIRAPAFETGWVRLTRRSSVDGVAEIHQTKTAGFHVPAGLIAS
jgi:hypothetical protein